MNTKIDKKVSVIIPAYNAESFINDSIYSVINQNHRPIQLIVVNDGSTDSTQKCVEKIFDTHFEEKIEFELINIKTNRGASNALNIGFSHASGEYICWLSADDMYIDADKISVQLKKMENEKACWSFYENFLSGSTITEAILVKPRYFPKLKYFDHFFTKFNRFRFFTLLFSNPINGSSIMIRKDIISKYGQFDPILGNIDADGDLWLRYSLINLKVITIPGAFVFYREHEFQTSKNANAMLYQSELVRMRILTLIEKTGDLVLIIKKFFPYLLYLFVTKQYLKRPITSFFLCEYILNNPKLFSPYQKKIAAKMLVQIDKTIKDLEIDYNVFLINLSKISESTEFNKFKKNYLGNYYE